MAMKPRRFSKGGSVVDLGAAGFQSPPPARKPPKSESEPVRKMRGGGMVKKMRGGGMVKKMRGGGMVKKK